MQHEINKATMKNDIVLTLSLIISIVIANMIMYITNLNDSKYHTIIFFAIFFILIKILYNIATRFIINDAK